MKNVRQFISGFLLFLFIGTAGFSAQLISDCNIRAGVNVQNPVQGAIVIDGIAQPADVYGAPVWNLAQWDSQSSLTGIIPQRLPSGALKWSDAYKTVILGGAGTGDGDVVLAVDSVNEYNGVYRAAGAPWPHLLLAQRISNLNGFFAGDAPWLSELSEVKLDMEIRLNQAEHIYEPTNGYSSSVHAAQFLLYFTIQNLRGSHSTNPDFGNYYWFGVRLYDDRHPNPGPASSHDKGTGKLIYNIGISNLCSSGLQTGEWKQISGNLLPHIKAGLQRAWELGYLTYSFDYADYKIGGMNIGWEVTGLSRVEVQVRNFGVQAYGVNYAKPYEFDSGETDGWTVSSGGADSSNGIWSVTAGTGGLQLNGPAMRLRADRYSQVAVRAASRTGRAQQQFRLFWKRAGDTAFETNRSVGVSSSGTEFQKTVFDLSGAPEWSGEIEQLRLIPEAAVAGDVFLLDYIRPVSGETVLETNTILKSAGDRIFWTGLPRRQYTLQQSLNLTDWTDVDSDRLPDNSILNHPLSLTNRAQFFRLRISAGP